MKNLLNFIKAVFADTSEIYSAENEKHKRELANYNSQAEYLRYAKNERIKLSVDIAMLEHKMAVTGKTDLDSLQKLSDLMCQRKFLAENR